MTVSSVRIERLPLLHDWFKVTIESRKTAVGFTKIELVCSDETLRQWQREIDKHLPPTNHDNLPWMKED
jgi:SNF2 family DNA or RNA helicase